MQRRLLVVLMLLWCAPATPQGIEEGSAKVEVAVEMDGSARVTLSVPGADLDPESIAVRLSADLSCAAEAAATWHEDRWTLSGRCLRFVRPRGFEYRGTFLLDDTGRELAVAGIRFLEVSVRHPPSGYDGCSSHSVVYALPFDVRPVQVEFGYGKLDIATLLAPPVVLALSVVACTFFTQRKIRKGQDELSNSDFFGYWLFLRRMKGLAFLAWPPVLSWSAYVDRFSFLTNIAPPLIQSTFVVLSLLGGPALLGAACRLVSYPVLVQRAGAHPQPSHFFWGSLVEDSPWLVPFMLALVSLSILEHSPRTAAGLLIAAFLLLDVLTGVLRRVLRMTPQAFSEGELADRVFALARTMGCELRIVHLIRDPDKRAPIAFAAVNGELWLADSALAGLSKREVDAAVAHELSHLKHRDSSRYGLLAQFGMLLVAALCFALWRRFDFAMLWLPGAMTAALSLGFLAYQFGRRRSERRADREALEATEHPRALVRGIAKTTQSGTPLVWDVWERLTLSHPSCQERAETIGRLSGRAAEELLAEAETGEPYEIPRTEETPLLFSAAHKRHILGGSSWALTSLLIVVPAMSASLAAPTLGTLVLGSVLTIVAVVVGQSFLSVRGYRNLERRIRKKLSPEETSIGGSSALFVSFYPCNEARSFEGFLDWDVGLLTFTPDEIVYRGERATFCIHRSRISGVELRAEGPYWSRTRRAAIALGSGDARPERRIGFAPARASTLLGRNRKTRHFTRALQEWLESSPVEEAPLRLDPVPEPCRNAPLLGYSRASLVEGAIMLAALAALTSAAMGLGFSAASDKLGWYVVGTALAGYVCLFGPLEGTALAGSGRSSTSF